MRVGGQLFSFHYAIHLLYAKFYMNPIKLLLIEHLYDLRYSDWMPKQVLYKFFSDDIAFGSHAVLGRHMSQNIK